MTRVAHARHRPREQRLDVGRVGDLGVGHDRRRVGIDEDDPVALLLESLARLGAGIVELAGLADDDRPGADEQDGVKISAFGHAGDYPSLWRSMSAANRRNK